MEFMDWDESFEVGLPRFDQDHKEIFALVNEMKALIKDEARPDQMMEAYEQFATVLKAHFDAEEALMHEHGYFEYTDHKVEHDSLLGQIEEFGQRLDAGQTLLTDAMLDYIRSWLRQHIKDVDIKYGPYFRDKGLPEMPPSA